LLKDELTRAMRDDGQQIL